MVLHFKNLTRWQKPRPSRIFSAALRIEMPMEP
jgi:hypothetical protein